MVPYHQEGAAMDSLPAKGSPFYRFDFWMGARRFSGSTRTSDHAQATEKAAANVTLNGGAEEVCNGSIFTIASTLQPKIKLTHLGQYAETEEDAVRWAWGVDVVLKWMKDRTGHEGIIELEMGVTCATPAEARARTYALVQDLIAALSKLTEEDFAAVVY